MRSPKDPRVECYDKDTPPAKDAPAQAPQQSPRRPSVFSVGYFSLQWEILPPPFPPPVAQVLAGAWLGCHPPGTCSTHITHPTSQIAQMPTHPIPFFITYSLLTSGWPSPWLTLSSTSSSSKCLKIWQVNLCSLKSVFQANVSVPLLSSAPQAASGNVRPGKHSPSPHPPPPPQTSPSFSFNLSPNLLMGKPRVGRKWNLVDQNKYEKGTLKIF